MEPQRLLLTGTALLTALMAGLFYSWSCSVVPGLARVPDAVYLVSMQQINRAIQNPVFFLGFLGAALLLPLCAWRSLSPDGSRSTLLIAAAVVYWIGVMGITSFGNVPLNNMLDAVDLSAADAKKLAAVRAAFEPQWVLLHTWRTVAAVLSLVLVLIATVRPSSH